MVETDPVKALCARVLTDVYPNAHEAASQIMAGGMLAARALLVTWEALRDSECTYELCGMDPSSLCNRCNSVKRVLAIVEDDLLGDDDLDW